MRFIAPGLPTIILSAVALSAVPVVGCSDGASDGLDPGTADAGSDCDGLRVVSCSRFCGDDVQRAAGCVNGAFECPSDRPIRSDTFDAQCEGDLLGPCLPGDQCLADRPDLLCSNQGRCMFGCEPATITCHPVGTNDCCQTQTATVVCFFLGGTGEQCVAGAVEASQCTAFVPDCPF